MSETFDWDGLFYIGLRVLRLSPVDFWSMTPREFEKALYGLSDYSKSNPSRFLNKAEFLSLQQCFPDEV